MNRRSVGKQHEERAAAFLESRGYQILERNFTAPRGEIDLIARDGRYLVFVEVKYRSSLKQGEPLEAVGQTKQARIKMAAAWYLMKRGLPQEEPCRFDVVGILGEEIGLVQNAF